ncbi:SusD/RagB family nutrient-binding outer membrane lipoprotein [Alkaliflexus imshenetskii]|uniref:SusD/RagB family nutrient-binding outer membrane lipoprotein n=1 Tax=Alkaliflexus imshenetskii TaxID=286730 RepID=UPI000479B5A8|nr:SusD/RagB family nutrient-binding outer membrane lipoprotein [Alkaliflexus imshenetskii]
MKNISSILLAFSLLFIWSCDKDDFAELNTDPSVISSPDLRFSATKAIENMYNNEYTNWFYDNFQYIYPWTQVSSLSGGNGPRFNEMGAWGGGQGLYRDLMRQTRDIQFRVDAMSAEDKAAYQALKAITYPIQIQPAFSNIDLFGSIYYSEAALGPFTNLLTPKMDSQEELFDLWLSELNWAIGILSNTSGQITLGTQDLVYGGDYTKWAKFCNLLKLKIAARLVNVNRQKAISIVEEVATSPVGYMNDIADDFIYKRGIRWYGTGNEMWIGYGSQALIDFMVENQDPRVRFHFEKNHFNAEVVQAFIEAGQDLPPYVEQFVELDGDGNFSEWKAPGEPWVRYHGAPISPDDVLAGENAIYFNQAVLNRIDIGGVQKTYLSTSLFNEKVVRTSYVYTYPTRPGGRVLQLRDNPPGLQAIFGTAAETYLYFAEFKLLGANLPESAQDYFNKGVEMSIRRADALANNNQLPYYNSDPVYTNSMEAEAAATKLRTGEIAALLTQSAYDLSVDALEKVYLQQYINFMNTPGDLWATVRRSGVPKKNSNYLSWQTVTAGGAEMVMPRRFVVQAATEDDLNYANRKAGIEAQGFTTGTNNPGTLNTERLWFDKNNPNYGEGPK